MAFLVVFGIFLLCHVHSDQMSYESDYRQSSKGPSLNLAIKPQQQTYTAPYSAPSTSFTPTQPLGENFVEVAVITAPQGPSSSTPATFSSAIPAAMPISASNSVNDNDDDDPRESKSDISVDVIVDDAHELFFNGKGQGWKESGSSKKIVYNFEGVKSGDVIGIQGKDRIGYAGMLVQINYLSGPYAGSKHVTKTGWICSRHEPKDNTWMTNGFSNSGKNYNLRRHFLDAVGHGRRGKYPWYNDGDIGEYDPAAQWFWPAHNFLVDKAWCRYEFDFRQPQDDRKNKVKNDDDDDD